GRSDADARAGAAERTGRRGRPFPRHRDPGRRAVSDIIRWTAAELADRLQAGEVSSREATQAHLDRIAAVDGDVHAFLHVNDGALDAADAIDAARASGEQLHPLAGVPLA